MTVFRILRDPVTVALIAAAVAGIGVLALFWSVKLDAYDRWGIRITCGTALASSYDQAALSDQRPPSPPQPQGGYVQQCHSAILWRRGGASAAIVLGAGAWGLLLLARERRTADTIPGDE